MRPILHDDPDFPPELRQFQNKERVAQIYVDGDLSLLRRPRVAIIGSRTPSHYGIGVAYEAARALASRGVVVLSGMAAGLDARAHRGALDAGGGTVAVLGTGLDVAYPRPNLSLIEEVRAGGLLITEFAAGTEPRNRNFPMRNRIIAALCQCLVVVEGLARGGTSNTVGWALKCGRTVLGVPGHLGDPLAESPNLIIRDSGHAYIGPNDVLHELGLPLVREDHPQQLPVDRPDLSGAEAALFDLIGKKPVQVDVLGAKTGLDHGVLLAALSSLEIQGLITQHPGKRFALAS